MKKYIIEILNQYPEISFGRKNHEYFEERLIKNYSLVKNYYKKKYKKHKKRI